MSAPTNIADWLLATGQDDAPALLARDQVVSYAELRRRVRTLSTALRAAGAKAGECVGVLAENTPFFAVGYLATLHAGLISVPFPAGTGQQALARIVELTGMRRLLAQNKFAEDVAAWVGKLGVDVWAEATLPARCGAGDSDAVPVDPARDVAAVIFTSGSTGQPKGVMISHGNIATNTSDIVGYLRLDAQARILAALPLSYCYGASLLHSHLRAGGSTVLVSSFMFPEKVLDELDGKACTGFAGVPSTYQILLRKTRFATRHIPHLRQFQQAGGKLPDAFIQELRRAHPQVELFIMYGQTEATARLSYLPPEQLDARLGSIGRGLPSTRLEVVGENGRPVRPGTDEVGQIVASGGNIALGYWKDPYETARFFHSGRLHTGDLARVDADGYIFIVDRAREFIKSMGNRVSPREVEEVICELPQVLEVGVVGVPSELWGEALCAYVVASSAALQSDEVQAHCNRRLPNFKVPHEVVLVGELPKNSSGKLNRSLLREIALARLRSG